MFGRKCRGGYRKAEQAARGLDHRRSDCGLFHGGGGAEGHGRRAGITRRERGQFTGVVTLDAQTQWTGLASGKGAL